MAIFSELGFIHVVETKANSTKYRLGAKKPLDMTLDDIFPSIAKNQSTNEINDPEQFGDKEIENPPFHDEPPLLTITDYFYST